MSILNLLIIIPVLAALAIILGASARKTALATSVITLGISLLAFFVYDRAAGGFQFTDSCMVLANWDLKYYVGADGLSLVLLLLTGIVAFAAVWVAPKDSDNPRLYYACLLLMAAGAFGAFASLDLFFFYIFHELALIPTFLLIGVWGKHERQMIAWKITLYLALGSFILLLGIIGLYWSIPVGNRTFDIPRLLQLAESGQLLDPASQSWVYPLLFLGFGILISLFPFHSWAPDAYASAPVPATMLHAGVLKKFGLYGIIRIAQPLLPAGAEQWASWVLILLIGNILYVGMVTLAQRSLDKTLGYSSVMHMGYIFLGIISLNRIGMSGAALLIFAHGLSIALLFALAGEIRRRTGSLHYNDLGGLAKSAPLLGLLFGFGTFASIGLPGLANFSGEILIFFGAFKRGITEGGFNLYQIATVSALWGVVISAIYMLRAYRSIFMGEAASRCSGVSDVLRFNRFALFLLIAGLLIVGFYPNLLLNLINPSLELFALVK